MPIMVHAAAGAGLEENDTEKNDTGKNGTTEYGTARAIAPGDRSGVLHPENLVRYAATMHPLTGRQLLANEAIDEITRAFAGTARPDGDPAAATEA
ncbi:hypothetical protein [Actinoplanes couchii]|uniref:Uncharacterized protein n=1 Tax=Actinoplanes couchii TaxID=403638 RepID=A0ABQ3XE63_9ACTN|nr:hypothetical protein [Actinoplanes couchii]MDR6317294.1 hypothetical protein [Actinoplanes couchii]GID56788.1 hypothetical protein Aco03nite_051920 [Actinoplanes couchii]